MNCRRKRQNMKDDLKLFNLRIQDKLKDFCWVSDKNKLVFFVIPKNASTSIRNTTLFKNCSNRTTFEDVEYKIKNENYSTFAVLREPVERFISAYHEVVRGHREDNPYDTARDKQFIKFDEEPKRFNLFLKEIESSGFFDSHLKPQMHFLTDANNEQIEIKNYLFFNNIVEDFYTFSSSIGSPIILPDRNSYLKKGKKNLLDYVLNDKKSLDFINKFYKDDIIFYNEKSNLIK